MAIKGVMNMFATSPILKKMIKFFVLMFFACFSTLSNAQEQPWPTQPVKFVLNLPAGSGPDAVMRKLADKLSQQWKQPVIIENKPGAAGLIAIEHYLKNSNDNHTVYFSDNGSFLALTVLYNKESLTSQLLPVAPMSRTSWVVIAPASVKDFAGIRDSLKVRPFYGSWSVGSSGHLCGAEINQILKTSSEHVPYKDYPSWYLDTSSGLLSFGCSSVGSALQMQRAGKINFVAVAAKQRLPILPNVPTVKELLGIDLQSSGGAWLGFFVTKKTNTALAKKIEKDLRSAMNTPEVQSSLDILVSNRWDVSADEFAQFIKDDLEIYRKLIKNFGIQINN